MSISLGTITSWTHIPHVQPFIRLDEFFGCDNTLKNDPAFQEALRKRGITDFREAEERPLRLARALTWVRADSSEGVAR